MYSFLVAGAGALGSAIGGMLRLAGHEVTLLGRNAEHLATIRERGLRITGLWGERTVHGLRVFRAGPSGDPSPGGAARGPHGLPEVDYVLVTVKSFDTEAILDRLAPSQPRAEFVTLQNGIGNLEAVASRVGESRAIGGMVIIGFALARPGEVTVTVYGGDVELGRPAARAGTPPDPAVHRLAEAMSAAGIPSRVTDNIRGAIWGKVLYNCALNALGAVLRVPYGELASGPARMVIRDVVNEAFAVASAELVRLPWPDAESYLEVLFSRQIPATAAHRASMLQDIERGKRTEIEHLNGAIARLGALHGLATPVNSALAALVRFMEARGRSGRTSTEG